MNVRTTDAISIALKILVSIINISPKTQEFVKFAGIIYTSLRKSA
jgi:hypothetical protein